MAYVLDFRCCLRTNVSELKLCDAVRQFWLLFAERPRYCRLSGILPAVTQHLPGQPLAVRAQDEERRKVIACPALDALQQGAYADHPGVLVTVNTKGLKSTAAGRYQLLKRYWSHYRDLLKLSDFGPVSQDRIALRQILECKALPDVHAGRIPDAIAKCRNIWASLPGAGYGQHERKLDDLIAHYIAAGGRLA